MKPEMRRSLPATKNATAYHESGHAIMGWKLGVALKKVTIVPTADITGACHHDKLVRTRYPEMDESPSTRLKMEKLAMIALAGPIAQRIYAARSFRNYHASLDYREAVDISEIVNGSSEQAKAWLKWLEIRTRDDIKGLWPIVKRLAQELLRAETLEAGEIQAITRTQPSR